MKPESQSPNGLAPHLELMSTLRDQINNSQIPDAEVRELPISLFTDEERFEQEREKAFYKRPIVVGHASMIPAPGDHFTHDDLGKPLLVSRGKDGAIRAFLNVCRHRGMRLVEGPGRKGAPSFVCPYHHWSYGLDGALNYVPLKESFGDTDLSCHGLKSRAVR